MNKKILIAATVLGMLSIVLGAFGAHGLKALVTDEGLASFETGVRYQMYHALFLLIVGLNDKIRLKTKRLLFILILIGLLFFSGSIYALATNDLTNFDFKKIAFITPIGGVLLIFSWLVLLWEFIKNNDD
jgi:uncharacterized membrane protein YgdD (TMEM256/DUF423 family)